MQTFLEIPMLPKVSIQAAMVTRLGSTMRAAASLLGKPQVLSFTAVYCMCPCRHHASSHSLMLRYPRPAPPVKVGLP